MNDSEFLSRDLPDPESAGRFLRQMSEQQPAHLKKLEKKEGLLSDILTLVSYSPLIAATLLQNPDYIWWLERERRDSGVRAKEELLESLARFSLTNSQVPHNVLLARFRRRELMRIFLADIRRLLTVPEITEGISNLADAVLENAVRVADQELQNRVGVPQQTDEKGKSRAADFAVVSLGKLGSRELNYSSDIDLLFIYSDEGKTSATGVREPVTNREYFSKLAETVSKLVGAQTGEGAAYRVDLRLRPHGRVGPLALSVKDTSAYYNGEAQSWERQVLIRSRASAGDSGVYQHFFSQVENSVFSSELSVEAALASVRNSKRKIDVENRGGREFNVKLGRGGIREIEFIAQAMQLAYGGKDRWLRAPHTLISLSRLADRGLIDETELTRLYDAYNFLRRLEHILQMEHGLQTHTVPADLERRKLVARRINCATAAEFDAALEEHTENVRGIFDRIFADADRDSIPHTGEADTDEDLNPVQPPVGSVRPALPDEIRSSLEKSDVEVRLDARQAELLRNAAAVSRRVVEVIAAAPHLINLIPHDADAVSEANYSDELMNAARSGRDLAERLSSLRRVWARHSLAIIVLDAAGELSLSAAKLMQTRLAEASIAAGLEVARAELSRRLGVALGPLELAIMGLGKLGSGGIDYDSDLDLVIVHANSAGEPIAGLTPAEFYSKAIEIFVTALSALTRDGNLYRIDLRLRPYGKNGASVISADSFVEYVALHAAVWELLAFVKLRAAGGDAMLGGPVEENIRRTIYERATSIDRRTLADETRRIRLRLEQERSGTRNAREVDIKFGPGGMLDIYFAVRYLQLRDGVPDEGPRRSTGSVLEVLHERGSLAAADLEALRGGYEFLSMLDHQIRLTVGRTTRLPHANHAAMAVIAQRMGAGSVDEVAQQLALHRIEVRAAFDRILGDQL